MLSLDSAYASVASSSATPIGSSVFLSLSFVTICALTLLLLRRFLTLRATPAYLTVPVFLALVLPASVVLLVPVDLTSTSREDGKVVTGVWLPTHAVLVLWRITYWLIFCLTWFVLPCPSLLSLWNLVTTDIGMLTSLLLGVGSSCRFWRNSSTRVIAIQKAAWPILCGPTLNTI